jgi:hypothetical protein
MFFTPFCTTIATKRRLLSSVLKLCARDEFRDTSRSIAQRFPMRHPTSNIMIVFALLVTTASATHMRVEATAHSTGIWNTLIDAFKGLSTSVADVLDSQIFQFILKYFHEY